ncbi:hypothetical protein GCM10007931_08270 [Vibrio algivorus]|uniref:Uncharacterized protein n=1 Tax=Vibrio algivorus TaxID=1667024 RepID=A0ABQ6EL63_9VIBR|nr:hypothetical protein GCM10007931_08270 [Vibrio algivorus]
MQNSELSSKPLNKEDSRRNVYTFQTNLTLCKACFNLTETRTLKLLEYISQLKEKYDADTG